MKAVVLTGTGGPEVLKVEERPDPPVGPGEVRIAVRAAGINFADTLARVGLYPTLRRPRASSATRSPARSSRWGRGWTITRSGTAWWPAPASEARRRWSPSPPSRCCRSRPPQLRAGRGVPGQLRNRLRGAGADGQRARGDPRPDPRRGAAGSASRRRRSPATPAPRSSAPRRPPSTTRSGSRGSPTRSTTAASTSRRR